MLPNRQAIYLVLALTALLLTFCGGTKTYTAVAEYGYSTPQVTEKITFSIVETGTVAPGKVVASGVSVEAAKAAVLKELQAVLPKGKQGVEIYVPVDLHPQETELPGCTIITHAAADTHGLLECDGIPTGSKYVFVFGTVMRTDNGQPYEVITMTVLPYHPAMTRSMGIFYRTRAEAEAKVVEVIHLVLDEAKSRGMVPPAMYYLAKPFEIPGCSIIKSGIKLGLITCTPTETA